MNDLGKLISEHRENETATGSTLIIGLVCFGLSAGMVFLFLGEKDLSFNKILFGLSAAFALLGGIGSVLSFLKNRGGRAELYENGLVAEKGGKRYVVRWNDISVVKESVEQIYFKGAYVYDRYLYTIEKNNGETFVLSNMLSGIDEIGRIVKKKTLEYLYPQAIKEIESGKEMSFGSLRLSKKNLSGVTWTEISDLKIENNVIEFRDHNGKTVIRESYSATPNAHLLLALSEKYLTK